jgi:hypothetical protein
METRPAARNHFIEIAAASTRQPDIAPFYSSDFGPHNTATGAYALNRNAEGAGNTATGYSALSHNITGVGNTATGAQALFNNTWPREHGDR